MTLDLNPNIENMAKKWHTIYLHWYTRTLSVPLSAMHAVGRIYAPSKDIIQLYCEWDMIDR